MGNEEKLRKFEEFIQENEVVSIEDSYLFMAKKIRWKMRKQRK